MREALLRGQLLVDQCQRLIPAEIVDRHAENRQNGNRRLIGGGEQRFGRLFQG